MKVARVFLPGRFEDAYIYRGWLVALTEERSLRFFEMASIVRALEQRFPVTTPAPEILFLRNDWLVGQQFKTFVKNRRIADVLVRGIEALADVHLDDPDMNELKTLEYSLDIPARVVLDLLIYNGRLYCGADSGLYHQDIGWDIREPELSGLAVKRTDARCVSTSAKYGTINASCGNEGLLSVIDDFESSGHARFPALELTAKKSLRSSWFNQDVVNYAAVDNLTLLVNAFEHNNGFEKEGKVLTKLGIQRFDLGYLFDYLKEKEPGFSEDSIQYVFNSNKVMFVHTHKGHFYGMGVTLQKDKPPSVRFTKTYKDANTRILSAAMSKLGVVIETEKRVFLFDNGEWLPLVESEVLTVRTFLRSKRFQNLVCITKENGILLAATADP